jgi:multidrug efflux pump subunit AcrA (membrane-fusion protein)
MRAVPGCGGEETMIDRLGATTGSARFIKRLVRRWTTALRAATSGGGRDLAARAGAVGRRFHKRGSPAGPSHLAFRVLSGFDRPMTLSEILKPAAGVAVVLALLGEYYWFEHRSRPLPEQPKMQASVVVTKAVNACFSDLVRVTGFVVPRREAVVGVEQEGSRVTDVLVKEGDVVTDNQELARLTPPPPQPGVSAAAAGRPVTLRAPAAGVLTQVKTAIGAPASPQAGPMFRIAVNKEVELDAEVPGVHLLKLNPGATVRVSRDDAPDISGRVRQVAPQIDRTTQLGHVRIALDNTAQLKVGMFARASIDAKRSCGVAVPNTAIDHLTVQVVKGNTVETRRVRIGLVSDVTTEIVTGLDAGEIVVADAGSSLHDGDQIKTVFAEDVDRTQVR